MGKRRAVVKRSTKAEMVVSTASKTIAVVGKEKIHSSKIQVLDTSKSSIKKRRGTDAKLAEEWPVQCASKLRPRKNISWFRKVDFSEADCRRIVGRKIRVYWPDSKKWFKGRVKSFTNKTMFHHVIYEDGDTEDLNLMNEQFELEVFATDSFTLPLQDVDHIDLSSDKNEVIEAASEADDRTSVKKEAAGNREKVKQSGDEDKANDDISCFEIKDILSDDEKTETDVDSEPTLNKCTNRNSDGAISESQKKTTIKKGRRVSRKA